MDRNACPSEQVSKPGRWRYVKPSELTCTSQVAQAVGNGGGGGGGSDGGRTRAGQEWMMGGGGRRKKMERLLDSINRCQTNCVFGVVGMAGGGTVGEQGQEASQGQQQDSKKHFISLE